MKKIGFLLMQLILAGNISLFSQPIISVSITGNNTVGSELTAVIDATLQPGNHYKYEWFTAPSDILLGENQTYTIQPSDNGNEIYFRLSILVNGNNNLVETKLSDTVLVNSFPVAGTISVAGVAKSNMTLYGFYAYSDAEGDVEDSTATEFKWYSSLNSDGSDSIVIGSGSSSYKLTDSELSRYIGFSVRAAAKTGSTPGVPKFIKKWLGPVTNDPPVANSVTLTGTTQVNDVITGHYTYYDANGDIEGSSIFEWWRSPDNSISSGTQISGQSGIAYKLALPDTGKYIFFRVTPKALTGTVTGTRVTSSALGRINTPPYVGSVAISGTPAVGSKLSGKYIYHDHDGDPEGNSIYRWLHNGGNPIPGAADSTYTVTSDDEGYTITFEVTPVSKTGSPDTGNPVQSNPTTSVVDNSVWSVTAEKVCIDGKRKVNEVLEGKYEYSSNHHIGTPVYQWYTNLGPIPGANAKTYTLKAEDIDKDIFFEITPVSNHNPPRTGAPVKSKSLARITFVKDFFYVSDNDTLLTAEPTGGYFYGEGVISNKFSPSSVDPADSPFRANYHLSTYSCGQDDYKDFTVTDVKMYFEGFNDIYCQNGDSDMIIVRGIPKGAILKSFWLTNPAGIVRQKDSTLVFDPKRMSAGFKQDTLFFSVVSGTSAIEIYRPFVIDSIAQVTIQNLDSGSVVCNNLTPYELFVSHPGGVFTGPVADSIFTPSLAIGDATVKYTYTTKRGCVSSVSVPIHINPAPLVAFTTADNCIESKTDTTRFINNTFSSDSVNMWFWNFSDVGSTSDLENPGYLYRTGGLHKVRLTATTINNCTSVKDLDIDLGVKPIADFYWENECFHPSDTLHLFDATISPSLVFSRSWNFFDGDSLHTLPNTFYPQKKTGYLPIEYIVRTNYLDCHDTIYREVYIRPTIHLLDTIYSEDFSNGNGGWVKDYNSKNIWSFGKPDRPFINTAASGDSAWFTRFDINNQKIDSSTIISPCFDFKDIQRPMIKINLWKRFDKDRDGAALQYKIGDNPGWEYVGTLNDGINWFNSALIKGKPGGGQVGWTATYPNNKDAGWTESRHKLDELIGEEDVKFRIAYGSNGQAQDNDGIAFDDIWIGQRTRGVLLEHFTNYTSQSAGQATELVSTLAGSSTEDIINIQYHTNFPGTDLYYDDNPAGAGARILFYGLSRIPYSFIDGGTNNDFARLFDYRIPETSLTLNDLTRRSLTNPKFRINLNSSVNGNLLTVSGDLQALEDISEGRAEDNNMTLYLAVTEKKNTNAGRTGALGETEYYNVFRKFIPDAGGISLEKIWSKGESFTLTDKTWIIEKIPSAADIEVIAFIQNNITKEIFQAAANIEHNIAVGIEDAVRADGKLFSLYPNPASGRLTVEFEKILEQETDIRIYDFSGSIVRTYKAGPGATEITLDELGLKDGIYLLRVTTGGLDWGFKKLIIAR